MWVVEDGREFLGVECITCMFSNLNHFLNYVIGPIIFIYVMVPLNTQFHVITSV